MASASTEANQAEVELFEKLDRFVKNNQHKKALKTAEDILAILPKDEDAQLCKIAALMQLGEWETAQTAIQRSPLASKLQFEKAFCLYRLGKNEEALNVLAPILASADHEQVIAALELAAQLHYRQGRSQQCIQLYDKLFQQYKVDSPDLKTNVLAAYVAAGLSREIPTLMAAMKVSADNSFEIGYNKACGLVDAGQWSAAEPELRRALKRGRETLFEEDCTEDEVEEELAPLTVQLAYVLGRQGRQPEAQELYDSVLRRKAELVDETTLAVAINNSFADSGRINALAAHKKTVAGAVKKLESLLENPERGGLLTLTPALEARLSASQKHLLGLNRALAYVLSGRVETARQLAGLLAKQDTQAAAGMPHLLPLLQAALLNKDGKVAEADAVLEQFVKAHPTFALEPTLARTQLALEAGDVSKAVQLLEELTGPGQQPQGALVATQAAFMTQMGDASGAEALLSRTLSALKNTSGPAVSWCLEALVALQLRLGKAQEALSTYTQLQATGTQSATAAALLARLMWVLASASAAGGAPKPLPPALTKGLPSLAAELRSVNVDALENSVASSRASALPTSKADQSAMEIDEEAPAKAVRLKKKSASKKRKRYPKGYDPTLPNGGLPPPDPERWTPKWQRSDAKKKKVKSSARGAVKGSQGAGKVDENLDRTKFEPKVEAKPLSTKPSLPSRKKGGKK